MMKLKIRKVEIAEKVGISRSTLYEELERGTVIQVNSDLTKRDERVTKWISEILHTEGQIYLSNIR